MLTLATTFPNTGWVPVRIRHGQEKCISAWGRTSLIEASNDFGIASYQNAEKISRKTPLVSFTFVLHALAEESLPKLMLPMKIDNIIEKFYSLIYKVTNIGSVTGQLRLHHTPKIRLEEYTQEMDCSVHKSDFQNNNCSVSH